MILPDWFAPALALLLAAASFGVSIWMMNQGTHNPGSLWRAELWGGLVLFLATVMVGVSASIVVKTGTFFDNAFGVLSMTCAAILLLLFTRIMVDAGDKKHATYGRLWIVILVSFAVVYAGRFLGLYDIPAILEVVAFVTFLLAIIFPWLWRTE